MWKRLLSQREHIWNAVKNNYSLLPKTFGTIGVVAGAENGFDYSVQDAAIWERDVVTQTITTSLYTIFGAIQGGSVGAVYGALGPVTIPVTAYVMMKRRNNAGNK